MLHIYVNGVLVPLPADIGIDRAKHLETSLHTHDGTGIIHIEAPHRFPSQRRADAPFVAAPASVEARKRERNDR
jgi:hypothetical protein